MTEGRATRKKQNFEISADGCPGLPKVLLHRELVVPDKGEEVPIESRIHIFGHGCSGHRMLLEHEWNYGLGMDAFVVVCAALWSEHSPNLALRK